MAEKFGAAMALVKSDVGGNITVRCSFESLTCNFPVHSYCEFSAFSSSHFGLSGIIFNSLRICFL